MHLECIHTFTKYFLQKYSYIFFSPVQTIYPARRIQAKNEAFIPAKPGSVLTLIQDLLGLLMCAVTP